jgi:hypothetical protein
MKRKFPFGNRTVSKARIQVEIKTEQKCTPSYKSFFLTDSLQHVMFLILFHPLVIIQTAMTELLGCWLLLLLLLFMLPGYISRPRDWITLAGVPRHSKFLQSNISTIK